MSDDSRRIHRRSFFRRGLAELVKPLADAIAPIEKTLDEIGRLDAAEQSPPPAPAGPLDGLVLRPPGALVEEKLLSTCTRSGDCVRVCPAQAIKLDPTGADGGGAPYIVADHMPCIACSGLLCMAACPSGALVPTPLYDIDMGTAVWRDQTCVRTTDGTNCTICVDQCPLGQAAIKLEDDEIRVNPLGCIGCGMCEHYCPTTPRSITVIPVSAKRR
jgi:MauM/NapG family ferredoxin protein